MGDKLWKDYGFIDAFNLTADWYDTQYIAIDQGPIICMIENYRTGLLWNLIYVYTGNPTRTEEAWLSESVLKLKE